MEHDEIKPREVVLAYLKAMDDRNYSAVKNYLSDHVAVKGPSGEAFRSRDEFMEMMQKQQGKYDLKKVFVDGKDVCVLYDFVIPAARVFFASWYIVSEGKISSIQTVFDPRAFAPRT